MAQLLMQQYGPTGAAARIGLTAAVEALKRAEARGVGAAELRSRYDARLEMANAYSEAYRRYCWPVDSVAYLRLAPFHLLASEGAVHHDRDHLWHLEMARRLAAGTDGLLLATEARVVDLTDDVTRDRHVRLAEDRAAVEHRQREQVHRR